MRSHHFTSFSVYRKPPSASMWQRHRSYLLFAFLSNLFRWHSAEPSAECWAQTHNRNSFDFIYSTSFCILIVKFIIVSIFYSFFVSWQSRSKVLAPVDFTPVQGGTWVCTVSLNIRYKWWQTLSWPHAHFMSLGQLPILWIASWVDILGWTR